MIAGHSFSETPTGRRCTGVSVSRAGVCYAPWLHVRSCTKSDIDGPGFAHFGKLTTIEFAEIQVEIEREEEAIWTAVVDAASSGSR